MPSITSARSPCFAASPTRLSWVKTISKLTSPPAALAPINPLPAANSNDSRLQRWPSDAVAFAFLACGSPASLGGIRINLLNDSYRDISKNSMVIADRLRAIREHKALSQGDIEQRDRKS